MSQTELKKDYEKRPKNKLGRKHCRDLRLRELEKQLEFAESRCGTLKQQLDYIKLLYGCNRVPVYGNANDDNYDFGYKGHGDGSDVKRFCYDDMPVWSIQNVHGEGEGGKCSIKHATSYSNSIKTSNSSKKDKSSKSSLLKNENSPIDQARPWKSKAHLKVSKVKKKKFQNKIKTKSSRNKPGNLSPNGNTTLDHVVTIYKNSAANMESETGLELANNDKKAKQNSKTNMKKPKNDSKISVSNDSKLDIINPSRIKSLNLFNVKVTSKTVLLKEESSQTEKEPARIEDEKTDEEFASPVTETEKNYSQPTIASKSKQVDKNMWNTLNIKNIPFIAATSTAPSHNIGVNIQQVLSIIKKRQPVTNETNSNNQNENSINNLMNNKKSGGKIASGETIEATIEDPKRDVEDVRSSLSFWQSSQENMKNKTNNNNSDDLSSKVRQLKKVLVYLHEDFTNLSQKYKKLQKKLTKRNIDKNDAKGELAEIERSLEKKEEEIMVVIGLYKEVLSLRDELKRMQEKYNFVTCGKNSIVDGLNYSNSAHSQMSMLLKKIQHFQEKLKQC